jgi:hypothetical protein
MPKQEYQLGPFYKSPDTLKIFGAGKQVDIRYEAGEAV